MFRALSALCLASLPSLLWTSPLFVERDNNQSTVCKLAPLWDIDGYSPMNELLGNVVVVALLKAS